MRKLPKELMDMANAVAMQLNDLQNALQEAYDNADAYYNERSEKWQEGEAGEQHREWADRLAELRDTAENLQNDLENLPEFPKDN